MWAPPSWVARCHRSDNATPRCGALPFTPTQRTQGFPHLPKPTTPVPTFTTLQPETPERGMSFPTRVLGKALIPPWGRLPFSTGPWGKRLGLGEGGGGSGALTPLHPPTPAFTRRSGLVPGAYHLQVRAVLLDANRPRIAGASPWAAPPFPAPGGRPEGVPRRRTQKAYPEDEPGCAAGGVPGNVRGWASEWGPGCGLRR